MNAPVTTGVIRSALAHLGIDRSCLRCLRGDLTLDLDRQTITCSRGCADVAGAIAEAARRLTGLLALEGEALLRFCATCAATRRRPAPDSRLEPAQRRSAERDRLYTIACGLPPSTGREAILSIVVGAERRANWQQEIAQREAEAEAVAA